MAPLKGEHIWISEGLQDQDAHFETLSGLFEELGVSSFDIASQPECDLLSFAETAFYFGVITDISKYEEPVFEVPAPEQTQASSPPPAGPSTSSVSVDSDDTWFTSTSAAARYLPLSSQTTVVEVRSSSCVITVLPP